jgi:hypothetical protein
LYYTEEQIIKAKKTVKIQTFKPVSASLEKQLALSTVFEIKLFCLKGFSKRKSFYFICRQAGPIRGPGSFCMISPGLFTRGYSS